MTNHPSNFNNIARSTFLETEISNGFLVLSYKNDSAEAKFLERKMNANYIQFHFCLKGSAKFHFNQGSYVLNLDEENSLLLYNPNKELPINLEVMLNSWMVCMLISIQVFHSLFSQEANYISFLNDENKDNKYYKDGIITPPMAIVLNQILNFSLSNFVKNLYFKAKAYELLSLYFNPSADASIEQCPFLANETNVLKIKQAKAIIINQIAEPPSLQELADTVGISLKKLKEGFKQIYGDTVYSFLFDYKMEVSRKLLEQGEFNVNEVGLKVGYSTASHFIEAFKKKYGITPKKYLQSIH